MQIEIKKENYKQLVQCVYLGTIGFNIYLYLLYHSAVIFITLLPAALFVLYLSACAVFCYKRYKKAKIKNKRKIKNKINN